MRATLLAIVLGVAVGAVAPGVSTLGESIASSEVQSEAAIGVLAAPATPTPEPEETETPRPRPRPPAQTTQQTPVPTQDTIIIYTTPHETEDPYETEEPFEPTEPPQTPHDTPHGDGW